ncbi:MAG: hypothetical protein AAGF46_07355 [Pseudomonadota bacterium]
MRVRSRQLGFWLLLWAALPVSLAEETVPFGLFDFLGAAVEDEDGEWIDPMMMDDIDLTGDAETLPPVPVSAEGAGEGDDDDE